MPTTRTPAKKEETTPQKLTNMHSEKAGPSQITPTQISKVRRSIGEWESGKGDPKPCTSTAHAHSPRKTAQPPVPAAPQKPKTKMTPPVESYKITRRTSADAPVGLPDPMPELDKTADRVSQARYWAGKARSHIKESRNLRADRKAGITLAVEQMLQLVTEEAAAAASETKRRDNEREGKRQKDGENLRTKAQDVAGIEGKEILRLMKEQGEKIDRTQREMEKLKETITLHQETAQKHMTYASATAAQPRKPMMERGTLHSIVVTSKDETETGDEVMKKVREAVNAKDGWVTVERVRKIKDKKVLLGCRTTEEREKVKERLKSASDRLNFEEMKNQDPMVILKDVIASNSDKDILTALRNQNGSVFHDIEVKDDRMEVKFRRKARNPLMTHVILRVSPQLYNRLMDRDTVHIDIQRVRVADQSPLVQCSMCLAYGHGKRFCKETIPKCTHCGGPHMKGECADWLAATAPRCCNCVAARQENVEHNAYSSECQVRRRWEALARAKVQYC